MTTDTEIINAALRRVGARRIMDASEAVGSAGIAADVLTLERENLLRAGGWNFAITRADLAPLADAPVYEFQYAFAVPSDMIRLIAVHDNDAGDGVTEFKLETLEQTEGGRVRVIAAAVSELWIKYVRNVTDANEMTPDFRQLLILKLAQVFATSVAKSTALYNAIGEEIKTLGIKAPSIDGLENYPDRLPEGSWATSRRRSAWGSRDWLDW